MADKIRAGTVKNREPARTFRENCPSFRLERKRCKYGALPKIHCGCRTFATGQRLIVATITALDAVNQSRIALSACDRKGSAGKPVTSMAGQGHSGQTHGGHHAAWTERPYPPCLAWGCIHFDRARVPWAYCRKRTGYEVDREGPQFAGGTRHRRLRRLLHRIPLTLRLGLWPHLSIHGRVGVPPTKDSVAGLSPVGDDARPG